MEVIDAAEDLSVRVAVKIVEFAREHKGDVRLATAGALTDLGVVTTYTPNEWAHEPGLAGIVAFGGIILVRSAANAFFGED